MRFIQKTYGHKSSNLKIFQLIIGLFVVFFVVKSISQGISGTRASDVPVKENSEKGPHKEAGGH